MRPEVNVPIPGPKAKDIVERDSRYLMTSTKTAPVAAKRAEGVWVEDVDGNRLLDFTSGIGVVNAGHGHPRVLKAMESQMRDLIHFAGTDFYYDTQARYAERLVNVTPGEGDKKVFYTNSGTESVEAALKLTRWTTERPLYVAFTGCFHGRTMGSLSLTSSKRVQREKYLPLLNGVYHVPYANPYRNPWGIDGYENPEDLVNAQLDYMETQLFDAIAPPEHVAAIFVEPIQGEGGYIVPPKTWLPKLRKLADAHGIRLVVDEVQTGFGRTGKLFASEHFGLDPDILCLAKGIANGFPFGAIVAKSEFDFGAPGAHSNTYGGNVLGCAVAEATLDAILEDGLVENAEKQGAYLTKRLNELAEADERIGDVRGMGLMLATDFVKDRGTREPDKKTRDRVTEEALKRGLVLLPCGKSGIRYIPPLSITQDEVDAGVEVLAAALKA